MEREPATATADADQTTANQTVADLTAKERESQIGIDATDTLASRPMSVEDQQAVALIREGQVRDHAFIQQQLADARARLDFQDVLFDQQETTLFGADGVLGGVEVPDDLRAEFDIEQSLGVGGPATLDLITTLFNDPNLSVEDKARRSGFLTDQTAGRAEQLLVIDDFIQQKQDLNRLINMPDADLLGNEANFVQPVLNYDEQPDAPSRQLGNISTALDEWYGLKGVQPSVAFGTQVADLVGLMIQNPIGVDVLAELQVIAQNTGEKINVEELAGILQNAFESSVTAERVFANALNQTDFVAGSPELSAALFQVTLDILNQPGAAGLTGAGGNPAVMANMFAASTDLHMLIDVVSGGRVGGPTRGGTISGIGGLTTAAYLGVVEGGYQNVQGDTRGELRALILYILENFGTPDRAIDNYLRTGEWGN